MREWNQWRPLRQLRQLRQRDEWAMKMASLVQHLPRAYRQGKMPYIFFFVSTVLVVLLTYAAVSPYQHATASFSVMSAWLILLLVLVNYIPFKYCNLVWLLACFKLYRLQLIQQ